MSAGGLTLLHTIKSKLPQSEKSLQTISLPILTKSLKAQYMKLVRQLAQAALQSSAFVNLSGWMAIKI